MTISEYARWDEVIHYSVIIILITIFKIYFLIWIVDTILSPLDVLAHLLPTPTLCGRSY